MTGSTQKLWTDAEIKLLRVIFPILGAPCCAAWFPRWSQSQISSKATGIGLHVHPVVKKANHRLAMRKRANPKEAIVDAAIKGNKEETDIHVAELTGVTVVYVRKRGVALGIKLEVGKLDKPIPSVKTVREWMEEKYSDIERLALWQPWGRHERELHDGLLS